MIRFRDPDQPLKLRGRWVFPVGGPPIENGLIEIAGGVITGLSARSDPQAVDLENVAIVPGLVNAHTHLELSDCPAPLLPMRPFTEWIRSVMTHRRGRPRDGGFAGHATPGPVWSGAIESGRLGTTCLGDITSAEWRPDSNPGDGPFVVAFREVLGLNPERIPVLLDQARDHLALARSGDLPTGSAPGNLRFGLSPHAPYSVHPDLLRGLVDLAREADVPVAMHLAETESELQLLRGDGGEFVEFLQRLGAWHDDAFRHERSVLDCLRELARARRGLVVHGNYLDSADCEFLARSPQLSVVYCPRTHAGFGHTPHPWQLLLVRGINVALGTDSKASNPDLSIWNELLFLHRLAPDFAPAALLELGTIAGARALGLENRVGSIALGKSADLAIIELPADAGTDPYGALFNPLSRVRSSVQAGRWHGA